MRARSASAASDPRTCTGVSDTSSHGRTGSAHAVRVVERRDLTSREQEVLSWIARSSREEGIPPSLRDVARAFGISLSGANYFVRRLVDKGALERRRGVARGLRVVEAM